VEVTMGALDSQWLRSILQAGIELSQEEEAALLTKARTGNEDARDLLLKGRLPQLLKIAVSRPNKSGMDTEDLFQHGALALLKPKGLLSYDATRGCKLATHANIVITRSQRRP